MSDQSGFPSVAEMFAGMSVPKVTEEGLFGGPYVRQGPLLITVGGWMFQCGSVLGYGLKDNPLILGKLLGIPAEHAEEYVQDVLQKLASKQLAQASGKDTTLSQLYLFPTLAEAGYELTPGAKWIDVKIKEDEMIFNFSNIAFQKGAAVGFHFPKKFQVYWANTYKPRSEDEWDEAYRMGIVTTPQQNILILEDEVCNVLADSADWIKENAPAQLTRQEISTLHNLVSS